MIFLRNVVASTSAKVVCNKFYKKDQFDGLFYKKFPVNEGRVIKDINPGNSET
jgi:hypothetical protein